MKNFPVDKFHFRSNSIFEELPETDMKFIAEKMIDKKIKKGNSIFNEGSYPMGIFFLKEGKVKKFKTNREGKEQIIYICSEGELLGYPALLSNEPYPDSAMSLEDCIVGFMSKIDFETLLDNSKVLSNKLLVNLSHEFGVLLNGIASFSHKTVRERLALSLLIMKDKYRAHVESNDPVEINLSREDLANLVGVAVETLVRLLHDFKEDGVLKTQGRKIIILDVKKLIQIANFY